MDYNPPGSSVRGIFQASILKWVITSFSIGSSQPRDRTRVSWIAGGFFTAEHQGSQQATMWMNLEDIMLREGSQTQKKNTM